MKKLLLTLLVLFGISISVQSQCTLEFVSSPNFITTSVDSGLCTANVSYSLPQINPCNTGTLTQTAGLPSGSNFPVGTTVNTYEFAKRLNIFTEDFSDNLAGWTLGNEWQIGPAVGSSCPNLGAGPSVDNSPSADNGVAGVQIGGCASTALHGFYYLTSPPIDVSAATNLTLEFYRWLNSDYTPFMQNQIEVFDGVTWQTVWQSGPSPSIDDNSWTLQTYDVTTYINANFQVRFGHSVGSGGVFSVGSWNIDDISLFDPSTPTETISSTFNVCVLPEAPVFTCPSTLSISNTGSACDEVVNYTTPPVSSCIAETTSITAGLMSGMSFPVGTTTVAYESVQDSFYMEFLNEDFSDNAYGWTLGTEWEIDSAMGSSCGGNSDPSTDHSPSADNGVAGVVIGGCASTGQHPYYYLSSPIIDVSLADTLTLEYYRWLNSDYTPYMANQVQVYDGSVWQTIWQTGGPPAVEDTSWVFQNFDITPFINDSLQVRFGFNIASGGVFSRGSWNLDDVKIYTNAAKSSSCSFDVVVAPLSTTTSAAICPGDTFILGTQSLTSAGTYTETFSLGPGCDSTVMLTLSLNPSYDDSISVTICDGDSVILGSQTLTTAGTYTEVFSTSLGCDSMVTLTLNVNPVYNEILNASICTGDTIAFGTQNLTTAGIYTEVFSSVNSCDSTVVLTLTENPVYNNTASASFCAGDSYVFGTQTLTAAGTYTETFTSAFTCDSTVVLTLSENPVFNETSSAEICDGDTLLFGSQVLTSTGAYTEVFTSVNGCDSTVILNLLVNPLPVLTVASISNEVNGSDGAINIEVSGSSTYSYLWDNNETSQDLAGLNAGTYVVVVTDDTTGCQKSESVTVIDQTVGIRDLVLPNLQVYPNPSEGSFTLRFDELNGQANLEISNSIGQVVYQQELASKLTQVNLRNVASGTYFIRVTTEKGIGIKALVIE